MLNFEIPNRRVSLRPENDFNQYDRRRSSFKVVDDYHSHLPGRLGSQRPSITSSFGSRRISAKSRVSTDSFEMSDYRGSFSIYNNEDNEGGGDNDVEMIDQRRFSQSTGGLGGLGSSGSKGPSAQHPHEESYAYRMLPTLPVGASVICLIMNIVLPGSGTIISGCVNLCTTSWLDNDHSKILLPHQEPGTVLCVNFWIGLCQLATVTFLFVGWFWSLAWGIYLVNRAKKHQNEKKMKKNIAIQQKAISVLLNDSSGGGAIRSGMLGINSMIQTQKKHFGIDEINSTEP